MFCFVFWFCFVLFCFILWRQVTRRATRRSPSWRSWKLPPHPQKQNWLGMLLSEEFVFKHKRKGAVWILYASLGVAQKSCWHCTSRQQQPVWTGLNREEESDMIELNYCDVIWLIWCDVTYWYDIDVVLIVMIDTGRHDWIEWCWFDIDWCDWIKLYWNEIDIDMKWYWLIWPKLCWFDIDWIVNCIDMILIWLILDGELFVFFMMNVCLGILLCCCFWCSHFRY